MTTDEIVKQICDEKLLRDLAVVASIARDDEGVNRLARHYRQILANLASMGLSTVGPKDVEIALKIGDPDVAYDSRIKIRYARDEDGGTSWRQIKPDE